jgi:hypothetical protein
MTSQAQDSQRHRSSVAAGTAAALFFLIVTLLAPQARAKMNVDFNPDLDFSKYKTFAYIGGVEHLAMMQLKHRACRRSA